MDHRRFMARALSLAEKGEGWVNPNPMVGAVIVKNGSIIGEGYHEKYGEAHAERNAINKSTEDLTEASMYVTLEPCFHHGKTPPCTEAIIASGISKVYIGSKDPNPKVAGQGISTLREAGIKVAVGILGDECMGLNRRFFHYIRTGCPYVTMKYAMTMDGKIATRTGKSKWITGELARHEVHKDRHRNTAIMVGVGTVLEDNPKLTCRMEKGRNPVRVVCDTNLRMPLNSAIMCCANKVRTIIATSSKDINKRFALEAMGAELFDVPMKEGQLDIQVLMRMLGAEGIDSILLEGGATLNYSALKAGVVNKIQSYIAPKVFGCKMALGPVGGEGVSEVTEAMELYNVEVRKIGEDWLIESEVKHSCLLD